MVAPNHYDSLVINSFLNNERLFDTVINTTLIVWFLISLVLVYLNRAIRIGEYVTLFLVSAYHVFTLFDVVHNDLAITGGSLGDFIVWIPLIIMFFFLVLGTKKRTVLLNLHLHDYTNYRSDL
ncbi:hypothetical protein [Mesobacillus boroniphilus]|uniref:Uncharacterized protein n=1 Tax=Mesobacillus boroniphilus JCM 21738 TaxID=1294265 RepID=W4RJ24_9BACI|nr:hypothetical protein [Mesobacillus boroniphilus]GAE44147.1 hypothetical protein JCM21738_832 [Mesobacillus boroniphilus JCM 21738]